jgi:HPt (histidine-containing phosphotransfer) domain-containing protein
MSAHPTGSLGPERNPKRGAEPSRTGHGESRDGSDDRDAIDVNEALRRVPGGMESVRELARLMLVECPKLVAEIHDGTATGNVEKLQRGAHTLRGSADVFCAKSVVGVARRLENLGRSGDVQGALELLEELDRETDRMMAALETVAGTGSPDE